jgi:cytoskeleton protein RodZ
VEPLQKSDVPLISVPGQDNAAPAGATAPAPGDAAAPASPAAPANPPAAAAATGGPAAAATGATPAQAGQARAPVQAASEAAVGPNALVLDVREDSWIQVRTAAGKNLISRLVKAGSTESVQVDQPVTMIVGNPKGVSASLRGANVDLPMLPGKTIARVTLK